MTAHWIEIGGSPLAPTWELRHRVLGSYAVQDSPIDHQGCVYYLHASVTNQITPLLTTLPNYCLVVLRTVIARLAVEQCRLFQLHVDFHAIVTDCGGNVAKAFNSTLEWDWLRYGCHLIHNVVKAGLDSLKNHALNRAQTMAATLQEALDRSVVLSFHCIFEQMICMLCQKNMCEMWYIPASSLRMYIFGNVHGPVYPTLISYINFHVPTSCFF